MVQAGDKVDPFDGALVGMVNMPANDLVFIGVGLFGNAIIHQQHPVLALDDPHMGFDHPLQVGGGPFLIGQKALHPVMADVTIQQG